MWQRIEGDQGPSVTEDDCVGTLCLSEEGMLQEGISKHRPRGKLSKRRELVGKSPKAGLISAEKWSFETERRSAGWRRLPTQGPEHSRVCTWKALRGFKLGKIWPVLCFQKTALGDLFPCAEYLPRNTQDLVILAAYRKRKWGWVGGKGGRKKFRRPFIHF